MKHKIIKIQYFLIYLNKEIYNNEKNINILLNNLYIKYILI